MNERIDLRKLLAPAFLVILYVFFSVTGPNFFGIEGLKQILQSCCYIGFMAFGMTFVIITGGIDLSIGANMMCSALMGAWAYATWGWPLQLAIALVIVTGAFFGLCNGVMIAELKLPPFIATLSMQMITMGFGSIVTNVRTMYYPTVGSEDEWFREIFYLTNDNVPTGIFWLVGGFLVAWVLLNKTRLGRYAYAIGSNEEATRLSGIKVKRWKIAVYAICGIFAAMAGLSYGAAYTTILPGKGNGEEMNGIAAVVIGGTSLAGGSGSMFGTLIGVLIMATFKRGLASLGLQAHWQTFFTGFVVIGAVLLDITRIDALERGE